MISVLCPTRNRPDQVARLLDSIDATATGPIEPIFYIDRDDPTGDHVARMVRARRGIALRGDRIVLSQCWNRCAEAATGEIMMQCGDDIVFRSVGWDVAVAAEFERWPDRLVLVHGDDGFQHARLATHGFLHRRWMYVIGEFVPGIFSSDWNDVWLTEVADALGRRVYLPRVLTEHMHPHAGKGPWDQTHRERWARHQADGVDALYARTADIRARWVRRLAAAIETATLTSETAPEVAP